MLTGINDQLLNQKGLKKAGSSSNIMDDLQKAQPETKKTSHKRNDSGSSTGSLTGYNIRNTLKNGLFGMFGRAKKEDENDVQIEDKAHEKDMSPYANHNINHGVMYTPDGEEVDPMKKKEEETHLYPQKEGKDSVQQDERTS